jgi:hypothetical protein
MCSRSRSDCALANQGVKLRVHKTDLKQYKESAVRVIREFGSNGRKKKKSQTNQKAAKMNRK